MSNIFPAIILSAIVLIAINVLIVIGHTPGFASSQEASQDMPAATATRYQP